MLPVWRDSEHLSEENAKNSGCARVLNLLISAVGLENVFSVAPAYDAVLVAPHVQYKRDEIANVLQDKQEIAVIESLPYAAFNGDSVLKFALVNLSQSLT
ncbi:Phosphotransferase system cellobiose-specific component IIB [Raoultella planticola]|uniref:Phosphotransferase system cellobiose-specific component IIB n=1 Tax=Raoultella planticola TaxID=575 RepID=A0A485ALE7_RAOPL|nr:Phosphotransferase system cellobiose-specific component IIB [Raoultella planticola]